MRKKALAFVVLFIILSAGPVGAWSLKDLLKGTVDNALDLFIREVMPVDGYEALEPGQGFWIHGEHFWNPDYYVILDDARVYWSYLVPTDVDVKVTVYKVYFHIFAFPVENDDYNDIWWKGAQVGDNGWIGAFFVWGFSWSPGHGWRSAKKAYIAYNLPSAQDLGIQNATILENGSVQLLLSNNTTKIISFDELQGLGNLTVENVTFRHVIGPLYIVRRG